MMSKSTPTDVPHQIENVNSQPGSSTIVEESLDDAVIPEAENCESDVVAKEEHFCLQMEGRFADADLRLVVRDGKFNVNIGGELHPLTTKLFETINPKRLVLAGGSVAALCYALYQFGYTVISFVPKCLQFTLKLSEDEIPVVISKIHSGEFQRGLHKQAMEIIKEFEMTYLKGVTFGVVSRVESTILWHEEHGENEGGKTGKFVDIKAKYIIEHPAFSNDSVIVPTGPTEYQVFVSSDSDYNTSLQSYDVSHPGLFLIFNHENFEKTTYEPTVQHTHGIDENETNIGSITDHTRTGTNEDAENLEKTAKMLNFRVEMFKDKTKQEIFENIKKYAKDKHSLYSCFACAILTHGKPSKDGQLLAASDQWYKFKDILDFFTADECPQFANKPKIFFIQACRGDTEDILNSDATLESEALLEDSELSISAEADFLVSYSTSPDGRSGRSRVRGSTYVNSLCHVFKQLYNKCVEFTLNEVLCGVHNDMAEIGVRHENDHIKKQMPSTNFQLTKNLYFSGGVLTHIFSNFRRFLKSTNHFLILTYKEYETTVGLWDAMKLAKTATDIGFIVHQYSYTSTNDIKHAVKKCVEKIGSQDSVFICAILTFSDSKSMKLRAKDGNIALGSVLDLFTPNQCNKLEGVPKLFFVQASVPAAHDSASDLFISGYNWQERYPEITPTHADILVTHSRSSTFPKVEDGLYTSLFVSTLCDVLKENHNKLEIMQAMGQVNLIMSSEKRSEVPLTISHLRQPVYL